MSLIDFYTQRDWAPLWSGDEAAHERVKAALDAIGRAAEHGLEPSAYAEASLSALAGRTDVEGKAELEWQLSLQVLRYARDLGFGHLAVDRDAFDVPVSAAIFAPELVLGGLATTPSPAAFLAGLAPVDGGYERLQALLASLRQQRDAGGWPHVPENETLKLGSTGAAVRALRDRLNVSGDLPATATIAGQHDRTAPNRPAASFDVTLERAVRAFQRRNGLEEDGVAGPATLQALNVSVGARLAQVAVNLERLRQGRRDLGQRYVLINVPDYHLTYVDGRGATPVHYESRVVVGTLRDQTPTFTGTMTYLDLNPSWYVPKSIAVREFLPKLRADPSYLERNNYALYAGGTAVDPWAVDWASVGRGDFPYRIRQLPGSDNALGRVKFMFPNKYNVYIHDTPSKNLFARGQRTFSHGCVRLAEPFHLAELLLRDQGWDIGRIEDAVERGKTRRVTLADPLPVYLTYVTAWVDPDGTIQFRSDIYGRDQERAAQLSASATRPFTDGMPVPALTEPVAEATDLDGVPDTGDAVPAQPFAQPPRATLSPVIYPGAVEAPASRAATVPNG